MRPILFQIGDFRFYSFGLMAALALIVPGLTIVRPLVRRRGVPLGVRLRAHHRRRRRRLRLRAHLLPHRELRADQGGLLERRLQRRRLRLVRRPHRRLPRRRRLDAVRRYPLDVIANAMAPATRLRLPDRAHRLPARRRRRLRQGEHAAVGDGLPQRHRAHPARRARPAHADLRDHRHEPSSSGSCGGWPRATTSPAGGRSAGSSSSPASSACWWSSCAATPSGSGTSRSRSG